MKRPALGLILLVLCLALPAVSRAQCTVNWTGGAGDGLWQTAGNWNPGLPGPSDNACIGSAFSVTLSANVPAVNSVAVDGSLTVSAGTLSIAAASTANNLTLSGGTLTGAGGLTVGSTMTWTGGTMTGTGSTTIAATGSLTISGSGFKTLDGRTLNNAGSATYAGILELFLQNGAVLNNQAGGTFDVQADVRIVNNGGLTAPSFNNAGTFMKSAGTGTSDVSVAFNNTGTVAAQSGTLQFSSTYTQTAGATVLNGGALAGNPNIQSGLLTGVGTITGNVTNAGQVSPGLSFSPGTLTITGNYTQTAAGTLNIKIGGLTAGTQYDQLNLSGFFSAANLNGTLNVSLINGFGPASGNSFTILIFASRVGTFATMNGLGLGGGLSLQPTFNPTNLTLAAAAAAVSITISPTTATVGVNGTQQFSATVTGPADTTVTWTVQEGAPGGSVTAAGLYTAPAAVGAFHVVARSNADPTKSAVATVAVKVNVTINPTAVTVASGGTQQFTSVVIGTPNTRVTWSVQEGLTGGTVNNTGLYAAPIVPTTSVFHVVATSQEDPTRSATATVTVNPVALSVVLEWPLMPDNRENLGQTYAQFNLVSANRYHTGLDIGAPLGTPVLAAADGLAKRLDMTPDRFFGDNHCMGNVVIIDHSFGRNPAGPFTLYAHLSGIDIEDGGTVLQGVTQIGRVGNTGPGPRPACGPPIPPISSHLHFEIKDRPLLHNPTLDGTPTPTDEPQDPCTEPPCYWGYTPNHPDLDGYHDPILSLHATRALEPPLRVRITTDGVDLRVGPGGAGDTFYRVMGQVNAGEEFEALRISQEASILSCSQGWYQIRRVDGARFIDTSLGGEIPAVWLCADFTGPASMAPPR